MRASNLLRSFTLLRSCTRRAIVALTLPLLACGGGLDVSRSVPIACSGRFDIDNTAMYNLAFDWTKHAKLKDRIPKWNMGTAGTKAHRGQARPGRAFAHSCTG